jgi:pimeloyl-ACP methyl ester carboxylesterase
MAKAILNKVTIDYRTLGEGRDIVLIHGLGANQGFWNPSVLIPMSRRYRVTIFDLRGHGYSGMPPKGYTSADMAEDLSHLLAHLNICRAGLVGHSFGGVVALHCAALFPEKVNSLILADARVRAFQPTQSAKEWINSERIVHGLAERGFAFPENEQEAGLWLLEKLASPDWRGKIKELRRSYPFVPFGGWNAAQRMADRWLELLARTSAREDFTSLAGLTRETLMAIQQPVLAMCCENSTALRSLQGMKTHLPHCETAIIPGSGHFFPLTHAEAFLSLVNRFVAQGTIEERRVEKRVALVLPLSIRVRGKNFFPVVTGDVSSRGLLIEGAMSVALGSEIEIKARANDRDHEISLMGKVVRMVSNDDSHFFRFGVALLTESQGREDWENFLAAREEKSRKGPLER